MGNIYARDCLRTIILTEKASSACTHATCQALELCWRNDKDMTPNISSDFEKMWRQCQDEFFSRKDCPFENELRHFVSLIQQKTGDL